MPGRGDGEGLHHANCIGLAILEQRIELRAVALKFRPFVEDLAEHLLYFHDPGADAYPAAQPALDMGRG